MGTQILMSIIKTLILILLSLLAIKLIKFAVATNKTLKQTKTKGIGPEKILWVTPTFVDEVVEWTQVPGNLNEAGFHHLWLGPMLGVLAAAPEAHKLLLTHKTAISKNFANVPPSLVSRILTVQNSQLLFDSLLLVGDVLDES